MIRRRSWAFRKTICSVTAMLVLALASCGGEKVQTRPVFPTWGKVFYQGQPAVGATVILHPLSASTAAEWPLGYPSGTVGADGTVQMHTCAENDGAPAGEYAIVVMWTSSPGDERGSEEELGDKLAGRYADASGSPWRIKVGPQATELPRVDLN